MVEAPTTLVAVIGTLILLVGAIVRWFMMRLDAKDKRINQLVDTFTETVNHKQSEMTNALEKLHESITYLTNIWKNGK